MPPSMVTELSNINCCPAKGVTNKSVPPVLEIVLPLILILSICNAVYPVRVPLTLRFPSTTVLPPLVLNLTLPPEYSFVISK